MSNLKLLRPLGIYLVIFLAVVISFHILLRLYYNYHYSAEKAEKLLSEVSSYKFFSDDPCNTAIVGDPVDSGLQYVKINLHCSREKISKNTLDLRAIKIPTIKGLLQLLGNINGFHQIFNFKMR